MKVRRIDRSTPQEPDTYTLQLIYEPTDIKNALLRGFDDECIASGAYHLTKEDMTHDIGVLLSTTNLQLVSRNKFADWLWNHATEKKYIIPTYSGLWQPNPEILRLKTGRTSARIEEMLDR